MCSVNVIIRCVSYLHISQKSLDTSSIIQLVKQCIISFINDSLFYSLTLPHLPTHLSSDSLIYSLTFLIHTGISRLEQDIVDFATDENAGKLPVLKATFGLQITGLDDALTALKNMINALELLRDRDISIVKEGVVELLDYCNGGVAAREGDIRALSQMLRQKAAMEASMVSYC